MTSKVSVHLLGGSDGDPTYRPGSNYSPSPTATEHYLEALGALWMKDRGQALPGMKYKLERLPAGYAVYGRPRPKDGRLDFYLFGHPGHRKYDSPNQFFPHFKLLMEKGNAMGCTCTSCGGGRAKRTSTGNSSKASSASKPAFTQRKSAGASSKVHTTTNRKHPHAALAIAEAPLAKPLELPQSNAAGMDSSRVDEEGTPDVYRNLINKLKREKTIDEAITENLSLDWRANQVCLPKLKEDLKRRPNWLPRPGEIVLFVRQMEKGVSIGLNDETGTFMLYHDNDKHFLGYPKWEAGQVGQTPAEEVTLGDVVEEEQKTWNVAYSGVRVEPLPDVNSKDKSLSKHHKYVPVHHTRPFIFWKKYLTNTDESTWHPTIKNALKVMSTMCLVDRYRFKGTWPEAWIYCSSIYIGAELLTIGDAVRLLPLGDEKTTTDVLVISAITLKIDNLDLASDNDYDEGRPYNSMCCVFGKGYTIDQNKSNKTWLTNSDSPPEVVRKYGGDHPRHRPGQVMKVPFSRIIGRLFDPEYLWVQCITNDNDDSNSNLDLGREGLLAAREYARRYDRRIDNETGARWFWANTRAEALDVESINGLEVSAYQREPERVPKTMRQHSRVLEAAEKETERQEQKAAALGQRLRESMASPPSVAGARGSLQREVSGRSGSVFSDNRSRTGSILPTIENDSPPGSYTGTPSSKKRRSNVINLGSDDDDDDDDDDGSVQRDARLLNYANRHASVIVKKARGVMIPHMRRG